MDRTNDGGAFGRSRSGPQRRTFAAPMELRQAPGEALPAITGVAIVYNRLSVDLGNFRERIAPGACSVVLASDPDVLAVWDHDTRYVLGRTASGSGAGGTGTLRLSDRADGLHFTVQPPDTTWARDLITSMQRGDTTQCSFAFTITDESWDVGPNGEAIATVNEIGHLYDVTVTARGAYPSTTSKVM